MPANTSPIFGLTPNVGPPKTCLTNTKSDGTGTIGTDSALVFTAGPNGSWVSRVVFTPVATAAATATNSTTCRVFLTTKSGTQATTGGTDTWLLKEVNVPSVTADHSTNATNSVEVPLNFPIPSGYQLIVTQHLAAAANTSIQAAAFGVDY